MGFVLIAILCLKPWAAFTTFVAFKSCVHPSLKKMSNVAARKDRTMKWDETIYRRIYRSSYKGYYCPWDAECEWWRLYKTTSNVWLHIRETFFCRRSLTEHQLPERIKKENPPGYGQCEVPENLRANFAIFPPIFKNTSLRKNDIGDLMKRLPKKKEKCLNLRECWQQAAHYKIELRKFLCWCFIFNWGLLLRKYTALLSIFQRNVSTASCSRQWTQEDKLTRVPIQVSLRRQWSRYLKFLWLSGYGPQQTHCNKVPQWRKDTCSC